VEHAAQPSIQREGARTIRVAAIGDLHARAASPLGLAEDLRAIDGGADVLVITGDLTESGRLPEAQVVSDLLSEMSIPKVAVLGNHDRRGVRRKAMRAVLEQAGVHLLDGTSHTMTFADGRRLGLAGVGGYGGGFWPEEVPDLVHARISKAVGLRARRESLRLEVALASLDHERTDATIVVLHYSPTASTLGEEPILKYWMLGNSLLGRVIDGHPVDLVLHGHAHLGNNAGQTPGGTPVRNVAVQVIGRPVIYDVQRTQRVTEVTAPLMVGGGRP
jgi:Icc-related predicted phosphoesterase